jgi:hypothetical protein
MKMKVNITMIWNIMETQVKIRVNIYQSFINVAHLNISSITQLSKQLILNDFLIKNNIQIMSMNETHLKPKHIFELEG